jgi:pimeloyl-ACP methyl ester carboxylesterase
MSLNSIYRKWYVFKGRVSTFLIALFILLTLPACVSHFIANQMVAAPNQSLVGYELSRQFSGFDLGHNALLKINGVSLHKHYLPTRNVALSFIDIVAADYGFRYQTKALRHKNGKVRRITTDWQWLKDSPNTRNKREKKSKVLILLHGWGRNKNSLLSYGLAFAQQGYRVIIPDLRGHGDSTGDWVSFGAEEGLDISALMDKLAIEKYDLIGFSLGASASLHTASLDERVDQLVIVAPMHSLAQTIPKFAQQSPAWLQPIMKRYQVKALAIGNNLSGYSYTHTSDTLSPAKLITKPTLFIYGAIDKMSDYPLNRLLFDQGSQDNKLHQLDGLRHTHVLMHQSALMPVINQWLGLNTLTLNNMLLSNDSFEKFHY